MGTRTNELPLNRKLACLKCALQNREPRIAIVGLGSVGNFLLNYLVSMQQPMKIYILGRNRAKIMADINIARVAADIRRCRMVHIEVCEVDLNNVDNLAEILNTVDVDFIVNSSRAYSHIKYGSISWNTVRAYGLWAPLSVKYIKNIMRALAKTTTNSIVINTSYSDAVNAWIKSAGLPYPDLGSGNLNHLLPRIRFAVAEELGVTDLDAIDIHLATSHFHDVVISKEGHDEGVPPLLKVRLQGGDIEIDTKKIYSKCAIAMPVDSRRNMMNASSNFEIIKSLLHAISAEVSQTLHVPGAFGMIGGYPISIRGDLVAPRAEVDESCFSLKQMLETNARSIYLDGVENLCDGQLVYTDELLEKTRRHFGIGLPKKVHLEESDDVAASIITNIIEKRA